MSATSTVPKIGDMFAFSGHTCYRPVQDRPMECRHGCVCGSCDGAWSTVTEQVADVIAWMDNSIDVVSVTGRRVEVVAPHGDAC